ncbi:MAG TPA: response regulator [Polyangiaceae bacterium]
MPSVLESQQGRPSRLVDARAEFVASLGRRLDALKEALSALEEQPRSAARRDQLLRRIHGMGAAARVLGFASVAEALVQAEAALQSAPRTDAATSALRELARALEVIPGLVSGASLTLPPPRRHAADKLPAERVAPMTVIVFGPALLAEGLSSDATGELEVESSDDLATALELVRGAGPDAVVIDCDAAQGHELSQALFDDPLLLRTPVLVVGEFAQAQRAAEYVARGAARVLVKPVSPETLQAAVMQAISSRAPRTESSELGELDVDSLAERIASEIRRGLVDAAPPAARSLKVNLGSGSEVLGAVWGAVARVREIVTLRSGGSLRFAQTGPEGAIPVGSWHSRDAHEGPRARPPARREESVSLVGRRVVVVDDDPAVAWFISGVLRAVGAEVLELHDGARALTQVLETWPDAVIADVLMPGLDGFALCRELKRDVAVRDVPVILLSWKEDLLQRLREIGADAAGYLRKEAGASTVVERVREVLAPRARVELRLQAGGEVRGRLDGLTPRLVLELATAYAPDSRVSLRDAAYLYELQIRGGRPRCATRTSSDGSFERGSAVLGPLLGVSAGRFAIAAESGPCRSDFDAPLHELLAEPVQIARAAQRAFSGGSLARVEAVELDSAALSAYRVPGVAEVQTLIDRLQAGASPRELLMSGAVAPALLESVLLDLARHGAVRAIHGANTGQQALRAESDVASFDPKKRAEYTTETPPPPAFTLLLSPPPEPAEDIADGFGAGFSGVHPERAELSEQPLPVFTPSPLGITDLVALAERRALSQPVASDAAPDVSDPFEPSAAADTALPEPAAGAEEEALRQSHSPLPEPAPHMDLADAVLGTLSEASLPPPAVQTRTPDSGTDVERSAESPLPATPRSGHPEASIRTGEIADVTEDSGVSPLENTTARLASTHEEAAEAAEAARMAAPAAVAGSEKPPAASHGPVVERRAAAASSPLRIALITLGAAAFSYGIVRYGISPQLTGAAKSESAETAAAVGPTDSHTGSARPASASLATPAETAALAAATIPAAAVQPTRADLPLPPGVIIAHEKGLLEIDTSDKQAIYVDGVFVGRGPLRRIPLDPGNHRVELRDGSENQAFPVEIQRGRRARVSVAGDEKPGARR